MVIQIGFSLMHQASLGGNLQVIEYLLSKGLSMNEINLEGKTSLHYMLENQAVNVVDKIWIIKKFAKGFDLTIADKNGKTPIDYVKLHCNEEVVSIFDSTMPKSQVIGYQLAPVNEMMIEEVNISGSGDAVIENLDI